MFPKTDSETEKVLFLFFLADVRVTNFKQGYRNESQNNSLFESKKVLLICKMDLFCNWFFFNN